MPMAGQKGKSGGYRAGAGRKRKSTAEAQASRRDVVLATINDTAWARLLRKWLVLAEETPSILYPLLPFLLGTSKQSDDDTASRDVVIRIETVDDRERRPELRLLERQ
jgi:hypothetical protein